MMGPYPSEHAVGVAAPFGRRHQRILVTGASGFIGSALVTLLVRSGHQVIAVSRQPVTVEGARTAVVEGYGDANRWVDLLARTDTVVHLAAPAHRRSTGREDSFAEYEASVAATSSLAHACVTAGVSRFVQVSSIGVNGNHDRGAPFSEASIPAPAEPYAIAKWQAECALRAVAERSTSMGVVILRPPLVYGRNAPGNFGRLARAVARGVPLPLASFSQPRSFLALDNLLHLIELCCWHPAARNELFLASDGEDLPVSGFLRRIGQAMGRPARLFPMPVGLLELLARMAGYGTEFDRLAATLRVDSSRVRRQLGWTPPLSVDEALRRAVGKPLSCPNDEAPV